MMEASNRPAGFWPEGASSSFNFQTQHWGSLLALMLAERFSRCVSAGNLHAAQGAAVLALAAVIPPLSPEQHDSFLCSLRAAPACLQECWRVECRAECPPGGADGDVYHAACIEVFLQKYARSSGRSKDISAM